MSKDLIEKLEELRKLNIRKRDLSNEISLRNSEMASIDEERSRLKKELELDFEHQMRRGLE